MAVFGEASRDVRTQALLDVEQDLVVARLIANEQQAQAVFFHDFQRPVACRPNRLLRRGRTADMSAQDRPLKTPN